MVLDSKCAHSNVSMPNSPGCPSSGGIQTLATNQAKQRDCAAGAIQVHVNLNERMYVANYLTIKTNFT